MNHHGLMKIKVENGSKFDKGLMSQTLRTVNAIKSKKSYAVKFLSQ